MKGGSPLRAIAAWLSIVALAWGWPRSCPGEGESPSALSPVVIDYFYEAGCPDCLRVKEQILPELRSRFEGFYVMNFRDVGIVSNITALVAYQEKLGIRDNEPVSMVVDYRHVLNGFDAIREGLCSQVEASVTARMEPGWREPVSIETAMGTGSEIAADRARRFAVPSLVVAGLIDGINPCAISTLVFFMSLLAVAKVRGGGLLAMGAAFAAASFVTYTAIGFGLLRALYLFDGLPAVRVGVDMFMTLVLVIFAWLSFRDAWRYRKSGDPEDVALQLPTGVKERIHAVIRSQVAGRTSQGEGAQGIGYPALVTAGLVVGAGVTALESVCTGQVYVPTLVLLVRSGGAGMRPWGCLLLYNAMFILPLVVVFLLTYFGLRSGVLLAWSRRNVVVSKTLMGFFFLAMALLLAV